ncbi:MAG: hypothetical protein ACREH4_07875 [Vitreimonas sp.]
MPCDQCLFFQFDDRPKGHANSNRCRGPGAGTIDHDDDLDRRFPELRTPIMKRARKKKAPSRVIAQTAAGAVDAAVDAANVAAIRTVRAARRVVKNATARVSRLSRKATPSTSKLASKKASAKQKVRKAVARTKRSVRKAAKSIRRRRRSR